MFSKLSIVTLVSTLALSALAMPTNLNTLAPRGAEGEPFQCPNPGATSAAKQALINAGAQQIGTISPIPLHQNHHLLFPFPS